MKIYERLSKKIPDIDFGISAHRFIMIKLWINDPIYNEIALKFKCIVMDIS